MSRPSSLRQYEGATQQLALFVKFVSRPPYLPALRAHNWAAFAKAYNGPGYAQNKYDSKLAAAYKRWSAELSQPAPPAAAAKRAVKDASGAFRRHCRPVARVSH